MFLSMLVAWLIPDVPRSLREQLKKENMALMEFLLNQDQEACAKTHTPKSSTPCFPADIDIVVEAPSEEEEVHQEEEEDGGEVRVEINLDEPGGSDDCNLEVEKSIVEVEGKGQEEQDDERSDEVGGAEDKEIEKDGEEKEEEGKGGKEEDGGEETEDGGQRKEDEKEDENEGETKAAEENFTIDLDSFMSELGLLGERRKPMCHLIISAFSCSS